MVSPEPVPDPLNPLRESNMMKDTTTATMTVAWLASAALGAGLRPGDVKLEDMKLTIMPLQESVTIESLPVIHGRGMAS